MHTERNFLLMCTMAALSGPSARWGSLALLLWFRLGGLIRLCRLWSLCAAGGASGPCTHVPLREREPPCLSMSAWKCATGQGHSCFATWPLQQTPPMCSCSSRYSPPSPSLTHIQCCCAVRMPERPSLQLDVYLSQIAEVRCRFTHRSFLVYVDSCEGF